MHLTPWQSWRNQIRKKNQEMKNPTQGKEMNEAHQWDVTNSHPDHGFLGTIRSLGSPALSSQVCTFVPISSCAFLHLSRPGILSCTDKNPGTAAPRWVLSWTFLGASVEISFGLNQLILSFWPFQGKELRQTAKMFQEVQLRNGINLTKLCPTGVWKAEFVSLWTWMFRWDFQAKSWRCDLVSSSCWQ